MIVKISSLPITAVLICLTSLTLSAQRIEENSDSLRVDRNTLFKAAAYTSAYYTLSLVVLSETWYKDKRRTSFHFYNDNGGYLQVDKFGHAFGSYVYSYIGYHYLLNTACSKIEALYFGATLGLILQSPIEIMDGLHEGYGFSWGDMAANAFGSALILGQELTFGEQAFLFKFSYWESDYAAKANGYLGKSAFDRLLNDYNGHTYWLSMPVNKLTPAKNIPQWLNIAVGYGANGMYGEFANITSYNGADIPETKRYRQVLLSPDINWTKIKTNSKFLKIIFRGMTFIKLPSPALEYNSMGKFRGYWIYW
jgi:hypothetical protein